MHKKHKTLIMSTDTLERTKFKDKQIPMKEEAEGLQPTRRKDLLREILMNPLVITRELNNRSLFHFLQYFWPVVSTHNFCSNWHIEYLCKELEKIAELVGKKEPREYDLIVNVPPGSTKTITCSIMFPVWCWTKWPWMRFICASYSAQLAFENADYCREIIRSPEFKELYPDLDLKEDKDTKSNFRVVQKMGGNPGRAPRTITGGGRYSTSVGGTLTGFHGDMLIVDDPLNPNQAVSDLELATANRWMEQTLSTRKTDKAVTPTILIMQRLHQDDPSGHILDKQKENIRHISLPGEIRNYKENLKPKEVEKFYVDDLLDPKRMPWTVLDDLLADLGQYGFAGQIGQNPTPPGGGMFKADHFVFETGVPPHTRVMKRVRYWDKAGTKNAGAFTAGVKMALLSNGCWFVEDVRRGRWGTKEREDIIQGTALADGADTEIWVEQEPGSGGKESAEGTIRSLGGFRVYAEHPTGEKAERADPYSVQVNNDNVILLTAMWNKAFVDEHRFFPYGTYKDQVDAAAGAFNKLVKKKIAGALF